MALGTEREGLGIPSANNLTAQMKETVFSNKALSFQGYLHAFRKYL
jgi:hypothetical protein